jgi:leucyl/phenylalanyl-tRNA---protein transferase
VSFFGFFNLKRFVIMTYWLSGPDIRLPNTDRACAGLLAAGFDLSIARLNEAYHQGVYPWYSPGDPILWWSPDPRTILLPGEFKLSRSLRKTVRQFIKNLNCEIRIDSNFKAIMTACAQTPRHGQHTINGTKKAQLTALKLGSTVNW